MSKPTYDNLVELVKLLADKWPNEETGDEQDSAIEYSKARLIRDTAKWIDNVHTVLAKLESHPPKDYCCQSVLGGWQTLNKTTSKLIGPAFNRINDLWDWQANNL
jgi:hypothetical protein